MSMPRELEILLVEDNAQDGELALRTLQKNRLASRIHWAKDGAEALDCFFGPGADGTLARPATPKVILLDLKLPKVDGLEVLRRLKSDPRTQAIPVVVLTSSREESDLVASYLLGVNSYIVKPVSFDKFSEAVTHLGQYWLHLNERPAHAPAAPSCDPP